MPEAKPFPWPAGARGITFTANLFTMLLRNAKQLEGHALRARDGVIGEVKDFYFDDRHWQIRYCVVQAGKWLQNRRVLISPVVFGDYDAAQQVFPVALTMQQVRDSPDIDTNKPVSRQHEEELASYYGWGGVFMDGGLAAPIMTPPPPAGTSGPDLTDGNAPPKLRGDPFLRSVNDTAGYHIVALDGAIGHAEDFLVDDEAWRIRYLVIDTRNWLPGKKVIVAPAWIRDVSWENRQVTVDLSRDAIQASPPYEPTMQWSEDYAARLHEHYGRPQEVREPHHKS
jgi:hypothetical protein